MFQVMLVDDEKDICDGLQYVINWEEYGFHVCSTAYNGAAAMELARKLKPDLIITDIKMPCMDGLELISGLNEEGLHCYYIVLSGFADFTYAQGAVARGVSNYLLKPVDTAELIGELERIRDALYKEKNLKSLDNARTALLQNFFLQNLANEQPNDTMLRQWKQYLPTDPGDCYYVVIAEHMWSERIESLDEGSLGETLVEFADKLNESLGFIGTALFFKLTEGRFGVLIYADTDIRSENITPQLNAFFLENFTEPLVFGVSERGMSAERFKDIYQDALRDMTGLGRHKHEMTERPLPNGKVTEIISYIDTHFDRCLDLQNLATEVFHFHPFYIGKIIKKHTGLSFNEYLNTIRIRQAVKLLRDPRLSITDVSQKVGYRYIDHFYKNFRKYAGMTPGDYRKKMTEQ